MLLWLIGFIVGVVGGFFGFGGSAIVTPALNILGYPMPVAIGTDLMHIFGKSLSATAKHRQLGHLDWKVAGLLALGTIPGMEGAAQLVRHLAQAGTVEITVRWVQLTVLSILSVVMLWEIMMARDGKQVSWRGFIAKLPLPPYFDSHVSKFKGVSVWGFILLGFLTGFMAGIMGGGGGFIRVPAMIYLLGMPTKVAVGTDLVEVLLSAGYGALTYGYKGFVDMPTALLMLLGGAIGARLGAWATFYAPSKQLRGVLGLLLAAAALSVALKQFGIGGKILPMSILLTASLGITGFVLSVLWKGVRSVKVASHNRPMKVESLKANLP
ncbi:MAG: sulfite exporter TauE/SafE family protein [Candidatus Bathyarchaeia archaeon]